jgi:hypothetical protein
MRGLGEARLGNTQAKPPRHASMENLYETGGECRKPKTPGAMDQVIQCYTMFFNVLQCCNLIQFDQLDSISVTVNFWWMLYL